MKDYLETKRMDITYEIFDLPREEIRAFIDSLAVNQSHRIQRDDSI